LSDSYVIEKTLRLILSVIFIIIFSILEYLHWFIYLQPVEIFWNRSNYDEITEFW